MLEIASIEGVGTAIAGLLASVTGVGAFLASRRVRKVEARQVASDRTAELERAEIKGWKEVIDTLTDQYRIASEEASSLRERLRIGNERFDTITVDLRDAQVKIAILEKEIGRLQREVDRLDNHVNGGKHGL